MKELSAPINNNEALASVAIGCLIREYGNTTLAKIMLVLPFILHPPTVKKLRGNSYKRSLEEFIVKNPECFVSFNARYFDFLPLSINAVTILTEMNVITVNRDVVSFNAESEFKPEPVLKVGKRATDFLPAIQVLATLFKDQNENSLYLKLKIEL